MSKSISASALLSFLNSAKPAHRPPVRVPAGAATPTVEHQANSRVEREPKPIPDEKPREIKPLEASSSDAAEVKPLDGEKENQYRSANQSLITKNSMIRTELALATKKIRSLTEENSRLREKIRILEQGVDLEKVEYMVKERFEAKLIHFSALVNRTTQSLNKSAEDFKTFMDDMQQSVSDVPRPGLGLRLAPAIVSKAPLVERVVESPLIRKENIRPIVEEEKEENDPIEILENDVIVKDTFNAIPEKVIKVEQISVDSGSSRRAVATPRRVKSLNKHEEKDTIQSTKSETPLKKPKTRKSVPTATPAPRTGPVIETDTVRRKRQAVANIGSLAEPRLGTKLRRPGKHDEPCPYISTCY